MLWGCFSTKVIELLICFEEKTNGTMYNEILRKSLLPSVSKLKMTLAILIFVACIAYVK